MLVRHPFQEGRRAAQRSKRLDETHPAVPVAGRHDDSVLVTRPICLTGYPKLIGYFKLSLL